MDLAGPNSGRQPLKGQHVTYRPLAGHALLVHALSLSISATGTVILARCRTDK